MSLHCTFLVANCICGYLRSTDVAFHIASQLITMTIEAWARIFSIMMNVGMLILHLWLLCVILIVVQLINVHLNMNLSIQMLVHTILNIVVIRLGLVGTEAGTLTQVRSRGLVLHLLLTMID